MIVVKENNKYIKCECALTGEIFDLENYVFTVNGGNDIINENNIKGSQLVSISKNELMKLINAVDFAKKMGHLVTV